MVSSFYELHHITKNPHLFLGSKSQKPNAKCCDSVNCVYASPSFLTQRKENSSDLKIQKG